jgi:hypothetical protein
VNSVSCSAAGECVAGGYYDDTVSGGNRSSSRGHAFVVSETNGSWGDVTLVPSLPASCYVPWVFAEHVAAARKLLSTAHCRLGTITKVYSKAKRGRIIGERPQAGRLLKAGAKIALKVSKGPQR